jgi:hypothetical protein
MAVATGIGGAAATAGMQGLQGTVEWNRLQLEVKMVSRELAGALLPAIQLVTRGLQDLRRFMERLSVRQQNLVMLGTLAFGGLALAGLARMGLAGLMGGAGAAASGVGALGAGAAGGALSRVGAIGAVGVTALAAGAMTDNPYLAMAGGAAAGWRYGGPLGALVGTVAGGVAAAPSDREGERPSGYWSRMRAEGHDMVGSTLLTGNRAIGRVFGLSPDPAGGPGSGPNPDRRMPTIADAGFEAPGSAFERITNKLAMVDAKEEMKPIDQQILDFLRETFGKSTPPRPSL